MNKIKHLTIWLVLISCLLIFKNSVANSEGFLTSKVSIENNITKATFDRKHRFLLKKMFRLEDVRQQIYSNKSNEIRCKRYTIDAR